MSNLQIFGNLFQVDFPVEIADGVLGRMQALYGDGFEKHYGNMSPAELQNLACSVLNGLTQQDIARGLLRMNNEKWCPKLPEFRSWCVSGGEWWTADHAWARAMIFMNDRSKPITTIAKDSLDEVRLILENEGQKAAHFAFRDIYHDYLQRAKLAGESQQFWEKAKKKDQKTIENNPEKHHSPEQKVDVHSMMEQAYAKVGKV
ncbi:hypothetical protein GCM10023206_07220 [Acinetobacter puyangensis]|uniref:Restriction endonuclease n=1 Tax=Acinetobacter puyangensis TaxID=1096779 RepID=A0A240E613_9GAMM|nr:restriction endonuclease [Acinetobacter puyangensis]SNX44198.1 hypothetical protein SAMN05421731_102359 [Acinetobacter puyangensis]